MNEPNFDGPLPGGPARWPRYLRWRVEYLAIVVLYGILVPLPHPLRLLLGRGIGRLAFVIDRRHARVAQDNLRRAYPEAGEAWCAATARGSFVHLGRLLVEVLLGRRERTRLDSRLRVEGLHHLQAVGHGRTGYFTLSGHFGNWEWIALHQASMGFPLWMVTRKLDNPYLEAWLARSRECTGNRVIHKRHALRELVKGLRSGRGIAFLVDQNFPDTGAMFVPFFGEPAATTPALGSLAVRLGAPILPVFAFPEADGSYRVVYDEPIYPPPAGDDPDAAALAVTTEATRRVEAAIRRQPSAWFWMHRRWRTRPGKPYQGDASVRQASVTDEPGARHHTRP